MSWQALSTRIDKAALAAAGASFLQWWLGELQACIPPGLRRALRRRNQSLVLELGDDVVVVTHATGDGTRELARIHPRSTDLGRERMSFLRDLPKAGLDVIARLPAAAALRTRIALPMAAERELRKVLRFELARRIPLKVDDVFYDYRVAARLRDARQLEVEVIVVPRITVERAVARARELGFTPDAVDVAAPDGDARRVSRSLLAATAPRPVPLGRRSTIPLLACCAAVLAASAVYIPLDRARRAAAELEREVASAKAEADRLTRAQGQIDQLQHEKTLLIERKRKTVPVIDTWNELTRLLPDDTWLTQLQISGQQVQIQGNSASAASLIGLLEGSQRFRKAMFRSPVLQDEKSGTERFQISVQIVIPSKEVQ